MWVPRGKGFFHILKNDEHVLVASATIYFTVYTVIEFFGSP